MRFVAGEGLQMKDDDCSALTLHVAAAELKLQIGEQDENFYLAMASGVST